MRVHTVAARTGWRWIADGWSLIRRQPMAMLGVVFLNFFVMAASLAVPILALIGPLMLAPVLAVGLMHAMREADAGRPAHAFMVFIAFRGGSASWAPLLVLGAVNAGVTLLAFALSGMADGGSLIKMVTGNAKPDEVPLSVGSILTAAGLFLMVYGPLQMTMWYAPLFVAWHRVAPLKALFFSFVTMARNWRAFLVYAVSWFGVVLAGSALMRVIAGVAGDSPSLGGLLVAPVSMLLLTLGYCSIWPTYRDVVDDDSNDRSAPARPTA